MISIPSDWKIGDLVWLVQNRGEVTVCEGELLEVRAQ